MAKEKEESDPEMVSAEFVRWWWKSLMANAVALVEDAALLVSHKIPARAQSLIVLALNIFSRNVMVGAVIFSSLKSTFVEPRSKLLFLALGCQYEFRLPFRCIRSSRVPRGAWKRSIRFLATNRILDFSKREDRCGSDIDS
jgi:hypothetical protein